MEKLDTIIIGGGPAGLTAALYLARYEKKVLLLTEDIGGQASTSGEVGNYPGFDLISGQELAQKISSQLKEYKNLEIKFPAKVTNVKRSGEGFEVGIEDGKYWAKTVLISAGKRHRGLGLKDEEALVGKGLSYCATCDGPFAKGKKTAVIGGGNSAADAAMILGKIAEDVTILNLNGKMQAESIRLEKIEKAENIHLINNAKTTRFEANNSLVSAVVYEDKSGKENKIEAQMIFIEIGYNPNSEIFEGLVDINKAGEIEIDKQNQTKTAGLFAAGDITDILHKQIIIACGEGAKAAMSINLALENSSDLS